MVLELGLVDAPGVGGARPAAGAPVLLPRGAAAGRTVPTAAGAVLLRGGRRRRARVQKLLRGLDAVARPLKPLGAADYITIARNYHTVFITDVPQLTMFDINEVRRFITLIDTLYEHNTKVVVGADAAPTALFDTSNNTGNEQNHGDLLGTATYVKSEKDEVFAFERTVSRLIEMQSAEYKKRAVHEFDDNVESVRQFIEGPVDDDSIEKLWMRYDWDGNGELDSEEFRQLMEDLSEVKRGHRNILDEEVVAAMQRVKGSNDAIYFENFRTFVKATSVKTIVRTHSRGGPR